MPWPRLASSQLQIKFLSLYSHIFDDTFFFMLPRQLKLHIRWVDEYNKFFGVVYDAAYNLSRASLHCALCVCVCVCVYLYLSLVMTYLVLLRVLVSSWIGTNALCK